MLAWCELGAGAAGQNCRANLPAVRDESASFGTQASQTETKKNENPQNQNMHKAAALWPFCLELAVRKQERRWDAAPPQQCTRPRLCYPLQMHTRPHAPGRARMFSLLCGDIRATRLPEKSVA